MLDSALEVRRRMSAVQAFTTGAQMHADDGAATEQRRRLEAG
jgi:hypothetical protein